MWRQPQEDPCVRGATEEGNGTRAPILLSLRDTDDFPLWPSTGRKPTPENHPCYPTTYLFLQNRA